MARPASRFASFTHDERVTLLNALFVLLHPEGASEPQENERKIADRLREEISQEENRVTELALRARGFDPSGDQGTGTVLSGGPFTIRPDAIGRRR